MIVNLVADLTVEQLREEVEFWRANSAAFLWSMKIGVEAARVRGQHDFATIIEVNYMMPHATALELALGGEYHETCEACTKPLLRGQLVFQNTDGGELHAACLGGQPTLRGEDDKAEAA